MSSEMREFEDLTNAKDANVKDTEKNLLSHQNDEQSDIRELRKKNVEGSKKVIAIKETVGDSGETRNLADVQRQELASHDQLHKDEVNKVESSVQTCLGGGINDMMNPDYFRDFLITADEPSDKKRPSYTLLRGSNDVTLSSEKRLTGAGKASNGPKGDSFVKDFADLGGLADIPINSNRELNYDVNGESPISSSRDIFTANAMRGSGGIQDSGSVSTGFQNVPLSRSNTGPASDIKPKPANRIANN